MRNATNLHCDYASEIVTATGPTGRFREVVEAVALDFGGNVVAGPGRVEKIATRKYRRPVRIVPTVLGVEVSSADALTHPHAAE